MFISKVFVRGGELWLTHQRHYTLPIYWIVACALHKILLLKGMDKNHLISKDNMKEIVRLAKRSLQPQDEILKYTHTKVVGKPCFIR